MKFGRRKKIINWHKKSAFEILPTRWAVSILFGLIVFGIIYLFISLGSLRFFLGNYFSITGMNKNYLVVLQNQYEARPTGGFISAYGVLKFRFFIPTGLEIQDSFKIGGHEYVEPPKAMGELLADPWYEGYTFRDANWNPDFSQSAQELISFYHKVNPDTDFAGVIGVNYKVVENLVQDFEPLKIKDKKITKNNLFHFLEYETKNVDKHDEEALGERKNVLKDLASALITKSIFHVPTVAKTMNQALAEKEIQLWFANEKTESKIQEKNWDGSFVGNLYADNLGVVLANLGGKKADRYLNKEVEYVVNFRENQAPLADLKITLTHHGDYSLVSDRYKGYLRIYLPQEADYQKTAEQNVATENNFQVIGQNILIEPGTSQTLTFQYNLPPKVMNKNQYFLNLHKQSGSEILYKVALKVPGDMSFETSDFDVRENRAFYNQVLAHDEKFIIQLLPDTTPPLVYEQKFDELNQLAIIFNEKLDPLNANEKANFEIVDSNEVNQTTDKIIIKKIVYDGDKIIRIYTEGITEQPLERYKIKLKNFQDKAGNLLSGEEKVITAVQRFEK